MEVSPALLPVTQVVLLVDDEKSYTSGSVTDAEGTPIGRTLEAACPYATQELADAVLAKVNGFIYQPFLASDALIPPAAELGDTVLAGDIAAPLAAANIVFDPLYTAEISAPSGQDIEHEYEYSSKTQREVNRKIAETRSLISKSAEEIRLEVLGLEGDLTQLTQTVEGFDARIETAEGAAAEASLRLDGFTVTTYDEDGNIKSVKLADGIVTADAIAANAITGDHISANVTLSAPTIEGGDIYGAAFYDNYGLGRLTLGVSSDYGDVPWLKFEDVENRVSLFEVVPTISGGNNPTILLGGEMLCWESYGEIYFGPNVKVPAVFA